MCAPRCATPASSSPRRLTVNLAPAEVPKEGTGFDLADTTPLLNRSTARD